MVITFSAPIRFASKVEISLREVKTYPEMYLMSSGYSSGKGYAEEHDFQKVKILENFDFSVPDRPGKDELDADLKKYLKDSKLPESWAIFNNPKKSIGEFYVNSRLHWLSTWRMELADMVCSLPRRNFKKFNGQKGKLFSLFNLIR